MTNEGIEFLRASILVRDDRTSIIAYLRKLAEIHDKIMLEHVDTASRDLEWACATMYRETADAIERKEDLA